MKDGTKACLNIWHSGALKFMVFTACALETLMAIRKILREIVDCKKSCEIPNIVENFAAKTTTRVVINAFNMVQNKIKGFSKLGINSDEKY